MSNQFTASASWLRVIDRVLADGENTCDAERGAMNSGVTREIIACQSQVDMHHPIVSVRARGLNYKFMAAEAWWILSGDDRVETISPYNKVMTKFSDNGRTFFGAYGPKIEDQRDYIVDLLERDVESRQAVINIWREYPAPSKDIPCTISAQFLVRGDKLHVLDTMRSSDAWLGWPYDVFNFSMLALSIILELRERGLKLHLGNLWLTAGSQHLYERNLEDALKCLGDSEECGSAYFAPGMFKSPQHLLDYLKQCADGKADLFVQP